MTKTIAVIDGNSLMHRAFHAVPPTMVAADGTPTNAVFGFLSMFTKFCEIAHPDAIVCAFDAGKPQWRIEALAKYKAQRPPMDDNLRVQFAVIEEIMASLNIPVVKIPGWEGDDILGTVAARCDEQGYRCLLVSGDKDIYQLVTDNVHVLTMHKGMTDIELYGATEVFDRYGVTPEQFPDYLGLMGDSVDNIPGVAGIGPKGATALLQAYQSIEGIYAHIDELKGKQKENLIANRDEAFVSRQVATIVKDLDFPLDLEEISFPSFDTETCVATFKKFQLNSSLQHLLRLVDMPVPAGRGEAAFNTKLLGAERTLVERACASDTLIGVVVCESDAGSLFSSGINVAVAIPEGVASFEGEEALDVLALLVKHANFVSPDVKQLIGYVYPKDTCQDALVSERDLMDLRGYDLSLASYILNSSNDDFSVEAMWNAHMDSVFPQFENAAQRMAAEACACVALQDALTKKMNQSQEWDVFSQIDMPLVAVLAIMERNGAAIDVDQLQVCGSEAQAELSSLREMIYAAAGEEFNIDSPKQLEHILFEVLGFKPLKKTKTGYSTDSGVLRELAKESDFPQLILRYRELAKIKSTYIDALPKMVGFDGRLHPSFNQTVTTTGRLSCSDPNIQNIPVRTAFGRRIREAFVPFSADEVFVSADYSQIELRVLANLSRDEAFVSSFKSGIDFHTQTASLVFGVPVEEVLPAMRSKAKAVNFGIVYGQQAFGLAQSLDIPFGEAKSIIDNYFVAYPGVKTYLSDTVSIAKEKGYAESAFGRRRYIPELRGNNPTTRGFGERTAMNHPMQGTAADIIKIAMVRVERRLVEDGFRAKLIMQVHDELCFSVPTDEVEKLSVMVKSVMESVTQGDVPMLAEVGVGKNWAVAH